ncbi:MAG: winged helix-turn-helix domain-containing protein [Chloroflexi bacterium]|nr:winged helix-turn-helix domain-containing protein [Chloroflexota bacterium]
MEPQGGDLLLTSFQGPYKNAFFQITRFRQGEGFPGLVAATGAPVVSDVLSQDGRYLREAVKEKGFHSYVCVPVFRGGNVEGSLNVAARGGELDTDRVQRLLAWASSLVGDVLERAFLQAGYATIGNSLGSDAKGDNDLEELGQRVLRCMMALGGATSGSLSVLNRNGGGQAIRVTEGTHAFLECRQAEIAGPYACPALAGGHGVALYGPRSQWHQSCRHTSTRDSLVQCVPLIADGDHVGMVQLAYTDNRPSPPTTHLAMLLGIASHASQALKQTRQETEERQERELKQSRVLRRLEEQASHSIEEHTAEEGQWERPFLDIRCLGPFKLYRQGSLITPDRVQRRGALTLLKVLLVRAGQPIPRDELVEILWPESDPKLTTNRLFVLVHTLRHLVEPAPRERQWVLIQGDGDSYRFNTEGPCRVDFLEFRRFTSLADRALADGDTEKCIACYETALDSYRGHFLEDEAYSEWCWEEREALRERFLDVVERLGHLYVLQGKLQPAIELYRRGLKSDPLREELHRGLIQTLWHSGRPAQALHQYQLCKEILEQELGIAPGPPIQELVTQIRRA